MVPQIAGLFFWNQINKRKVLNGNGSKKLKYQDQINIFLIIEQNHFQIQHIDY